MNDGHDDELSWDKITVASRKMLPTYVVFFAGVGINFLVTPLHRLAATPGLQYVDVAAGGIRIYGGLFLAIAGLIVLAMRLERLTPCLYALYLAAITLALWALMQIAAAIWAQGSPSGFLWPWLGCRACIASAKSLRRREA